MHINIEVGEVNSKIGIQRIRKRITDHRHETLAWADQQEAAVTHLYH